MIRSLSRSALLICFLFLCSMAGRSLRAQAPQGPLPPAPGTPIQPTPPEAQTKITARVTLIDTPVTVRDSNGDMIHDLDQQDFVITDDGVPQNILHFDVGGAAISLAILVETSSRADR